MGSLKPLLRDAPCARKIYICRRIIFMTHSKFVFFSEEFPRHLQLNRQMNEITIILVSKKNSFWVAGGFDVHLSNLFDLSQVEKEKI